MALAVNLLVIAGSVLFVIAWYLRNRAAITPTKPSGVLRPVRIAVLGVGCNIAALVLALSGTHPRLALATLGVTAAWIGLWLPKRFRRVRVESETVFRCQAEEAFDFFSDSRNEPRYQFRVERVEQLSPQRIGVGSVFRAWVNVAHGSQPGLRLVVDEEITEYFPPRYFTTRIVGKIDRIRFTFSPTDGGTGVTAVYDGLTEFDAALLGGVFRRAATRQRIIHARDRAWARAKAILEEDAA
jgi:hypothetical protein